MKPLDIFLQILFLPPDPSPTCNSASVGNLPSSGQTAEPESETSSPTSSPSADIVIFSDFFLNKPIYVYQVVDMYSTFITNHNRILWELIVECFQCPDSY